MIFKEIRSKTEEILKITFRPNQSGRTNKHKHSNKITSNKYWRRYRLLPIKKEDNCGKEQGKSAPSNGFPA